MERGFIAKKDKKMKAAANQSIKEKVNADLLFIEGIEMAKHEVSQNLWHNMNIKRIQLLVSFCMDFLKHTKGYDTKAVDTTGECYIYYPYLN